MSGAHDTTVTAGEVALAAILNVPAGAPGIVLFAHGSGSGRLSPRNTAVADVLAGAGLGTLLIDLLTPDEEAEDRVTRRLRFDIALLAERVVHAVDWLGRQDATAGLAVGTYGASTGAAAALIAAADRPDAVRAVVSRGGRPDLAGDALPGVTAPTLLVVGGEDRQVLDLNRQAQALLRADSELEIVAGAGHLFEEPGALEQVADLTAAWFGRHLAPGRPHA